MKLRNYCLGLAFLGFSFMSPSCQKEIKVGLLMDSFIQERWTRDKDVFIAKIQELGGKVLTETANGNMQKQFDQATKLLDEGVKVLVVVPVDQNEAARIVSLAHKYKVPVISYDRFIKNCNLDLYISFDNEEVGRMQADYLTRACPKGNYGIIGGATTDNNSFMMKIGQMNVLSPLIDKGDIKIVYDQYVDKWDQEEGYRKMKECLMKNKKVDAVLVANDDLATGVIRALKEVKLDGKIVVSGEDADLIACQRIVAGTQSMTVYKPIEAIATRAAVLAMRMAEGESCGNINMSLNNGKKMVPSVLLPPMVVNRETIKLTVVADGYLQENNIYPKETKGTVQK
jgi:D-xylose transport system substrate-binding protein